MATRETVLTAQTTTTTTRPDDLETQPLRPQPKKSAPSKRDESISAHSSPPLSAHIYTLNFSPFRSVAGCKTRTPYFGDPICMDWLHFAMKLINLWSSIMVFNLQSNQPIHFKLGSFHLFVWRLWMQIVGDTERKKVCVCVCVIGLKVTFVRLVGGSKRAKVTWPVQLDWLVQNVTHVDHPRFSAYLSSAIAFSASFIQIHQKKLKFWWKFGFRVSFLRN